MIFYFKKHNKNSGVNLKFTRFFTEKNPHKWYNVITTKHYQKGFAHAQAKAKAIKFSLIII